MKKSFTFGAIAGATSLAVAAPLIAQMVSAASEPTISAATMAKTMPIPSQTCVQAMADMETKHLSTMDTMHAAMKTASADRRDGLVAAAAIADDTQRQEAVKKAQDGFREAMKKTMDAQGNHAADMEAMKTACGDSFHFGMGMGGHGNMFNDGMKGKLAEKLGMTEDELKAALDSGKTIEDLAKEKGIELPARRGFKMKHMGRGGPGMMMDHATFDAGQEAAQ